MRRKRQSPVTTPSAPAPAGMLQRACACGQHTHDGGECESCRQTRLSRARASAATVGAVPQVVHDVLSTPGQPLDMATRADMEARFGQDFSRVRVHSDAQASASARAVNARAYTVGPHVAFASGQFQPQTGAGQRLLAHELAHVVQQHSAASVAPLSVGSAHGRAEHEAAQAAAGVAEPSTGTTEQTTLQREPDDTRPQNLGPPVQELPLPPRCSIMWKDGKWSWKCEGIPKIGSTPDIPLDPRDIPDRIRDLIPKAPGGGAPGGQRTFPWPPAPGSDLPPNWMENLCKRNPASPLCFPLRGKTPDQPKTPDLLVRPVGIFWTTNVLFEHDSPSQASAPNGGMTADGASALDTIIFLLNADPTLQVRLIGYASSEGDAAHNMALSKRRAQLVYQKLEAAKLDGRVISPITSDGRAEGCTKVGPSMWACGESQSTQGEIHPEERKVAVTFHRNPPLPSGPLKLTLPGPGGQGSE